MSELEVLVGVDSDESSRANVTTERETPCEYDPETGRYSARLDGDATDPVAAVVRVVAAVAGADPLDLPPLFESVDSSAFDTLLLSAEESGSLTVSFEYVGHDVTVVA